eukprot:1946782-Karenia_brevis.AAC.1
MDALGEAVDFRFEQHALAQCGRLSQPATTSPMLFALYTDGIRKHVGTYTEAPVLFDADCQTK